MHAGAPDTTIRTCSAFISPRRAFPGFFRCFNVKTRVDGSATGASHVDLIAADWLVMFHVLEQRRGANLPADLWRIELRRHIEKA